MTSTYKVTYFPLKALGEGIRLLLSYGNVEFEDIRVTTEEWAKLKPSTPLGQLPTLEIDGKVYYQTLPICRYLGQKFGLAGQNDLDALQIDIVVATLDELRSKAAVAHYEPDEQLKAAKKEALEKEVFPFYLGKLESFVEQNNGYFACGQLTWADVVFAGLVDYLSVMIGYNVCERHASLSALVDRVKAVPPIKAWYEKAPPSAI